MKLLLTLALLSASLLFTGCEAIVVDRHHVGHDGYYGGRYGGRYDGYDDGYRGRYENTRPYQRSAVVVVNRPVYRPAPYYSGTHIVYVYDRRGKYYVSHGKKIYVSTRGY